MTAIVTQIVAEFGDRKGYPYFCFDEQSQVLTAGMGRDGRWAPTLHYYDLPAGCSGGEVALMVAKVLDVKRALVPA